MDEIISLIHQAVCLRPKISTVNEKMLLTPFLEKLTFFCKDQVAYLHLCDQCLVNDTLCHCCQTSFCFMFIWLSNGFILKVLA